MSNKPRRRPGKRVRMAAAEAVRAANAVLANAANGCGMTNIASEDDIRVAAMEANRRGDRPLAERLLGTLQGVQGARAQDITDRGHNMDPAVAVHWANDKLALVEALEKLVPMTKGRPAGSDGPLVNALAHIIREKGDMPNEYLRKELIARFEEGDDTWCFEPVEDESSLDIDHVGKAGKGIIKWKSVKDAMTRARKRVNPA